VISTALKQGHAQESWVAAAIASMIQLNRDSAEALHAIELDFDDRHPVHAVTDVTGFGLLGHAREMAAGSEASMSIDHERLAYLPGAIEAARAGFFSGGLKNNREFLEGCVEFSPNIPDEIQSLLYDPQTSGGLLVALASQAADSATALLERRGISARVIGTVIEKRSPLIAIA
jgi:selenide,water dikinase